MTAVKQTRIPTMKFVFKEEDFPKLCTRYTRDELKDILVKMCLKGNVVLTKKDLYSQGAELERDMEGMFG